MIWLMVEYGSKTGRRAMQLELLTKFFGHWVRSWLVEQGRHVVRDLAGAGVDGKADTFGGHWMRRSGR
jgi:hypothetical protein